MCARCGIYSWDISLLKVAVGYHLFIKRMNTTVRQNVIVPSEERLLVGCELVLHSYQSYILYSYFVETFY